MHYMVPEKSRIQFKTNHGKREEIKAQIPIYM